MARPTDPDTEARVARARSLGSAAEAIGFYRDWAADYDRDVFERLRFTGTRRIAELLAEHAGDRAAPVVDLGCGTGHLGLALRPFGFRAVDGLDLSPDMLRVAEEKRVYRETIAADLLKPLPVPAEQYGAAGSAGTFTTGHVDAGALAEILRIVRPGGVMAFVIAGAFWEPGGFETALERLQSANRASLIRRTLEPVREGGPPEAWFAVWRKL